MKTEHAYLVCQKCVKDNRMDGVIDPVDFREVSLIYPHIAPMIEATKFWVIEHNRHGDQYMHEGEIRTANAELVEWLIQHYLHGEIHMHTEGAYPNCTIFIPDVAEVHKAVISTLTELRNDLTTIIEKFSKSICTPVQ